MDYSGMKVLIMGLGLHGGGLESARYMLRHGAELTVTDLRDEQTLALSIEQLEAACRDYPSRNSIRYVLGKHEIDDFKNADMVIKNPGVRPDSPFLQASRCIETDISLFLTAVSSGIRLTAVTGSKGKSSTASALHWILAHSGGKSYLGGNITVSPLTFLDDLKEGIDVVLELSSWQLGDLRGRCKSDGSPLLKPKAAVLTAIMPDHLDRYDTMEAYIADKRVIYQGQDSGGFTVAGDDSWGKSFLAESSAQPLMYSTGTLPEGFSGGWFDDPAGPGFARLYGAVAQIAGVADGKLIELVPAQVQVLGHHQKQNLLAAGLALLGLGMDPETIREGLGSFPGVEHRMEWFHKARGIDFYNDSAATIPEAAAAAVETLANGNGHLILVTGGSDKNLDFTPLVRVAGLVKAVVLLAGSGSEKLRSLLEATLLEAPPLADAGLRCLGPFDSLDEATVTAFEAAAPGDRIVLSPGCASFGMFLNEFDRGRRWKEAVKRLV
jgi:UDP-N-acetylmuramoylalanine--D-glutamate ligase